MDVLAIVGIMLAAASAMAQGSARDMTDDGLRGPIGPEGPSRHDAPVMLLRIAQEAHFLLIEHVQNDLKLTDDQKIKINDIAKDVEASRKNPSKNFLWTSHWENVPSVVDDTAQKPGRLILQHEVWEWQEKREGYMDETRKKLYAVLTTEQLMRLKQIRIQVKGFRALTDPEVQKELALSDEQKKKIRSDINSLLRDLKDIGGGRNRGDEIRKDYDKAEKLLLDVLTPEQKEKFEEMKGKIFVDAP
jgi:Spy/CpxP family protein refolding chaperone